jgi:hypothetical protein
MVRGCTTSHRSLLASLLLLLLATAPVAMAGPADGGAQGEYGKPFKIKRDKTVSFPDFDLTFHLHSHKDVRAGGPSSPLLVYLFYKVDGRKKPITVSLHPESGPAGRTWEWSKYRFTLLAYEYNQWMRLVAKKK